VMMVHPIFILRFSFWFCFCALEPAGACRGLLGLLHPARRASSQFMQSSIIPATWEVDSPQEKGIGPDELRPT
jgi:hypothetical protein